MHPYNLFLKFYSPLVLYHPITLDAIVAYCLAVRRNNKNCKICFPQQINDKDEKVKHELHHLITHHTPLYPVSMASNFQPIGTTTEYLDSWKKHFESKYAHLADFGKAKRKIDTGSGKYRSYNMPLPALVVQMGYFAFIGKGNQIVELLQDYVVAIGKKRSEGFGWIAEMDLREADYSAYDIARMRPVPKEIAKKNKITGKPAYCGWQSPYWLRENICECVVPK